MGTVYTTAVSTLYPSLAGTTNTAGPNDVGIQGGRGRHIVGTIALGTGDIDDNDIIMLAAVPSNARILGITLYNDDLDSDGSPTLAYDVGLYTTAGAVVDRDAYALAATDFQAANTAGVNVAFEARNINKIGQKVWQDASATSDPGDLYLIAVTIETAAATAAAGDLSFDIEYTID